MEEFLVSLVEMAEESWEEPHHFPGSVDWEASVARHRVLELRPLDTKESPEFSLSCVVLEDEGYK